MTSLMINVFWLMFCFQNKNVFSVRWCIARRVVNNSLKVFCFIKGKQERKWLRWGDLNSATAAVPPICVATVKFAMARLLHYHLGYLTAACKRFPCGKHFLLALCCWSSTIVSKSVKLLKPGINMTFCDYFGITYLLLNYVYPPACVSPKTLLNNTFSEILP